MWVWVEEDVANKKNEDGAGCRCRSCEKPLGYRESRSACANYTNLLGRLDACCGRRHEQMGECHGKQKPKTFFLYSKIFITNFFFVLQPISVSPIPSKSSVPSSVSPLASAPSNRPLLNRWFPTLHPRPNLSSPSREGPEAVQVAVVIVLPRPHDDNEKDVDAALPEYEIGISKVEWDKGDLPGVL